MKQLILALAILLTASIANAEVIIKERNTYYTVPGTRKGEIIRNMERYAPFREEKFYVPAFMKPDLRYEYHWEKKGDRCAVTDVTIYLTITYKYPRLAQEPAASYIKEWWESLMQEYKIHEELHGEIAIEGAHKLEKALLRLDDMNCESAKETIAKTARYFNRQTQKKQEEYDRITNHGMTQDEYY